MRITQKKIIEELLTEILTELLQSLIKQKRQPTDSRSPGNSRKNKYKENHTWTHCNQSVINQSKRKSIKSI